MGDQGGGVQRPGERDGDSLALIAQLGAAPYTALLGGAGTGKTHLLKQWLLEAPGQLALCATTGIAAVNLGEGTTLNAFLRYFDTASLVEAYTSGYLQSRLRKYRRAGLTRILLDEVSMMDGNQLTVLVRALGEVNGTEGYDLELDATVDDTLPPLGLTVVGDFCQLPPVKAPFAFESPEWSKFTRTTLDRIWRQTDPAFIAALRAARRGDGHEAVDCLAPCFAQHTDPHFEGPTLLATNDAVDRYNRLRMDTLSTPERRFQSTRWGTQRSEWKQIPEELVLKEGCLVMILANSYDQEESRYRYVNGDLGTLVGIEGQEALVHLQRTDREELIKFIVREVTEPLEVGERKAMKAAGEIDKIKAKSKVVGAITYLPVRVAYATTIHKSQGLSLDKVQINLREGFMGSPGMAYVGLSRARTRDGLRLIGSPQTFIARCVTDKRVAEWI